GAPTAPNELPDKPPAVVERAVAATEPAEADGQELAELYRLLDAPSGEALAVPFLEGGDVLGALLVAMPANVQLQVDAELAAGVKVAERLRQALQQQRRSTRLPTVSAGIASVPGEAKTKAELFERADAALYVAKRAGKNRVAIWGERGPATTVEPFEGPEIEV